MNPRSRIVIVAAVLFCLVVPVTGAPLDKRHVSANAKWLVHIDTELLRHNSLAGALRQHYGDENAEQHMAKLKHDLGLASWDDLKSVLVYGTSYTPGDGVMIVKAKVDRQAVLDQLKGKTDYATVEDGNSVRHSWTDTSKRGGKTRRHTVTLMFYPGDLAVITRNPDDFGPAVKVLDGSASNLADATGGLTGAAPRGASVYGEIIAPDDDHKLPARLQMIRQLRHLDWALVHAEDDVALQVTATAANAQAALQFQQIIQGFTAMLMLRHGAKHEELTEAVDAMRVKADGDKVRINWRMTNEQVMHIIEQRRGNQSRHDDAHDHQGEST